MAMSTQRPFLLLLMVGALSACQAPPHAPPPAPPAPAPEPAATPAPEPPPAPSTPEGRQQAQKSALAAADMLQSGNEDAARLELKRALALDAQNRLASSLTRQMTVDPATLGRESFSYTVRPGDTLAVIAQRHLNDPYLFYLLARYNDIKVPRQLSSGQVIRVPGKASTRDFSPPSPPVAQNNPPPRPSTPAVAAPSAAMVPLAPPPPSLAPPAPPPPPVATPAELAMRDGAAAEKSADLPRALAAYGKADSLGQAGAAAKAEQVRTQLVSRYTLAARNAFSKQDLKGAISNWQRVLELDPSNTTAHAELDRSKGLDTKLSGLK